MINRRLRRAFAAALLSGFVGATALGVDAVSSPAEAARRGASKSLPDLVTELSPAVVNISSSVRRPGQPQLTGAAQRMQRKLSGQAVSLGSGFIIDPSGVLVTNNHVIDNAVDIKVTLSDGREFSGRVRAADRETDLAIVELETGGARLPFVQFADSDIVRVGEDVFAIGNPFGLGNTVTKGIVSARNRDIDAGSFDDFIQTDAAINRGNSGGPLFNMSGKVVGVNTAIYSQTGGSVGVGFAVPADLAKLVTDQLLKFGETRRGWLGVSIEEMSVNFASELGFSKPRGAIVTLVRPNSPALKGGLKPNDIILTFNRREVNGVRDLTRAIAETPVGETVPVQIIRNQKRVTLQVTVDRRETNILAANAGGPLPAGAVQSAGVTFQKPTPEVLSAFDLPRDTEGVVVTSVDPESQAAIVLQPGDVILEIGWERMMRPQAAADKLSKLRNLNSGPVLVYIQRGNRLFFDSLRP
ncbi:MAG: Do family serine endopeptidase [Pseudomonadota bacterium]